MFTTNQNTPPVSADFLTAALAQKFGELHFKIDPHSGMIAIIAIHSTHRGPALGGCRFIPYQHTHDAILDVMALAKGMSYKSAMANLPLGGGKGVIIQPPGVYDRQAYMHQFGAFVDSLNGRYITALDSGTFLDDMDLIAQHTPHVASLSSQSGDPAPSTALTVLRGIQAAALFKLDRHELSGLHVAIQGLGHVGYALAEHLHTLGVRLSVADRHAPHVERAVRAFGATAVPYQQIHQVPCDIFSPCALGGVINEQTIDELQTTIIAGGANNQLADPSMGERLHQQGILFAPDYVINAGGVIFAASKYLGTPQALVLQQIEQTYTTLLDVFYTSLRQNKPTPVIADAMAQERLG